MLDVHDAVKNDKQAKPRAGYRPRRKRGATIDQTDADAIALAAVLLTRAEFAKLLDSVRLAATA